MAKKQLHGQRPPRACYVHCKYLTNALLCIEFEKEQFVPIPPCKILIAAMCAFLIKFKGAHDYTNASRDDLGCLKTHIIHQFDILFESWLLFFHDQYGELTH